MPPKTTSAALLAVLALAVSEAHADLTSALAPTPIVAPSSVGFNDSVVTVGTISTVGAITYNFLDTWTFTLANTANVASIATAISFTDASGASLISGISNLQVKLRTDPAGAGTTLVSWLTVSMPAPGLQQEIALIPTSALVNGNYALEIRGTLTSPGSYAGTLITSAIPAVPTPAAWSLMLSGLLGFGFLTLRSRQNRH